MKTSHKLLALLLAVPFIWSCEETVYPELENADPQIVIDAWISNSPEPQYIRITETLPYFDSVSSSGVENALIYIFDIEDNTMYHFAYKSEGFYEWTPSEEYPRIGTIRHSYGLYVEINGKAYTSTSTLNRVPEIDSISFSYKDDLIYPEGYYAQFYASDFVGVGDMYWIKTYKNNFFLNKPNEINLAFDAGFLAGSNVDGTMFLEPIREMINPWDEDENGEELPSYAPGDSVFVEVHSINYDAYSFLSELRIQTDRPGGFAELFSVPLANIPTNIICMDSEENRTIGFFNISAVSSRGEWLDPDNLPTLND